MKEEIYVIFSSVTIATGVKKLLDKKGITAILMHTPKSLQLKGCSYSLKVNQRYYLDALEVAKDSGATVIGVFKSVDGGFREVKP